MAARLLVRTLFVAFACAPTLVAVACGGEPPTAQAPTVAASASAPVTSSDDASRVESAASADGGDASVASVPIQDADRVIAGLRARFRSCYQQGLNGDPRMAGRVVVIARIAPNGAVSSSVPQVNDGLSSSVAECMATVVRGAQFSPPGGNGSTLQIPITFLQQVPSAATAPTTSVSSVGLQDADLTIAKLRPKFHVCMQQGLRLDPGMGGRVVFATRVEPDGSVSSVKPASGSGLSAAVLECIASTLRAAHFNPPGPSGSTLQVPVSLAH